MIFPHPPPLGTSLTPTLVFGPRICRFFENFTEIDDDQRGAEGTTVLAVFHRPRRRLPIVAVSLGSIAFLFGIAANIVEVINLRPGASTTALCVSINPRLLWSAQEKNLVDMLDLGTSAAAVFGITLLVVLSLRALGLKGFLKWAWFFVKSSLAISLSFAIILAAQLIALDFINFPNYVAYWLALITVELQLLMNPTIGTHVGFFYAIAAIDSITTHIVFFTENSGCPVAAKEAEISLFRIVALKVLASANLINTSTLLSGFFRKLKGGVDTPFFGFDNKEFYRPPRKGDVHDSVQPFS